MIRGLARVWIGPEPERGAHTSVVGIVTVDALGVSIPADAMVNWVDLATYEGVRWPMGDWNEWSETGRSSLLPWHRVDCIDWHNGEGETVESIIGRGAAEAGA